MGTLLALVQINVKRMLAYSSISHIGIILTGTGIGIDLAYKKRDKPLEQLWSKMTFVAMPILAALIILSVLGYFRGPTYYPLGRFFDLFLTIFVIVVLLIIPILEYHSIVKTQKANFIEDIERKIDRHYSKIKEALSEEEKDLEKGHLGQIRQLQEIMGDVKSIPSWPFRTYQKIYIFLGALIPLVMESAIPWIMKVINYFA